MDSQKKQQFLDDIQSELSNHLDNSDQNSIDSKRGASQFCQKTQDWYKNPVQTSFLCVLCVLCGSLFHSPPEFKYPIKINLHTWDAPSNSAVKKQKVQAVAMAFKSKNSAPLTCGVDDDGNLVCEE